MRTFKNDEDFQRALQARVKRRFEEGQFLNLDHGRAYVAYERFLTRLFQVSPNDWALKGGLSLEYRLHFPGRTTKDIDLDIRTSQANVENALEMAVSLDLEDRFYFSDLRLKGKNKIDKTKRYTVNCTVAGRQWSSLPIDVGLHRSPVTPVEQLPVPSFLDFAGYPPLTLPVTSVAQQIAEKLHAYVKPRPTENTRVKDLIDLQLLVNKMNPSPQAVAEAVIAIFETENSAEIPIEFPYPPPQWAAPYGRDALRQSLPQTLEKAHKTIAEFINPILSDLSHKNTHKR